MYGCDSQLFMTSSDFGELGCRSLGARAFSKHLMETQHSAILTLLQKCDKIFISIHFQGGMLNN